MDISVIIPVFNTEKYLSTCIESVIQQEKVSFEIILVDNNSKDGTIEYISHQYPCVIIKEMEENGWERGQDDEELFEFAMHEKQYREFKSGQAKEQFLDDLAKRKAAANAPSQPVAASAPSQANNDEAAIAMALYLSGHNAPFHIVRPAGGNMRSAWRWSHVVYQH